MIANELPLSNTWKDNYACLLFLSEILGMQHQKAGKIYSKEITGQARPRLNLIMKAILSNIRSLKFFDKDLSNAIVDAYR